MLILAIDTTSEVGGAAIFRDHVCLARIANDGPANRYSVSLFSMVDQAIEEAKARHGVPVRGLADMGLIAVANGPGSFTGIRVGLAAAQGWAKAFGLPQLKYGRTGPHPSSMRTGESFLWGFSIANPKRTRATNHATCPLMKAGCLNAKSWTPSSPVACPKRWGQRAWSGSTIEQLLPFVKTFPAHSSGRRLRGRWSRLWRVLVSGTIGRENSRQPATLMPITFGGPMRNCIGRRNHANS